MMVKCSQWRSLRLSKYASEIDPFLNGKPTIAGYLVE